ncbi:thiaminase II [Pasteurellaceae bacterium USgator11]|nr:thiaminase II [Pasteurellaceae bacterium UScroc12]TNG96349.1 thiaminase II [Pasteurellaceae bacterium UScroc31]TNG98026.1 thiaminase II [Pasteurellaceae bacterium USgator41]TNH02312.1 thiaminase II [Pasteurellaceae bacterium USgator11]
MSSVQQLIQNAEPHWRAYIEHDFVLRLADGTLDKRCFQHYLKQDYRYLFHYNRALALALFKAENFAQMEQAHHAIQTILQESKLHVTFCQRWGIAEPELLQTPESAACVAYTRYVLDCGINGSLVDLYAAIAPCALGYAEIARHIVERQLSPPDNPYQDWIDTYASDDFQLAAAELTDFLDQLCQELTEKQRTKVQTIFNTATRMEVAFWQMGLDLS